MMWEEKRKKSIWKLRQNKRKNNIEKKKGMKEKLDKMKIEKKIVDQKRKRKQYKNRIQSRLSFVFRNSMNVNPIPNSNWLLE